MRKLDLEILVKIKMLCKKHKLSLIDKIFKEDDMLNLKSLLTEAHFGIFFDEIGLNLKYNQKAFKGSDLTPDFIFTKHSQEILAEVCRVNPAERDMIVLNQKDKAIEELKKDNPDIPVVSGFNSITWKPDKLNGKNSSLSVKANKYGPLVEENSKPIILCIYLDFISGLDNLDLSHSLYGSPAEFVGDFAFQEYFPRAVFHDLSNALFYCNHQMRRNVSGVLLRNNDGSFAYYHNFSFSNKLNADNVKYFLSMQQPYE